MDVAISGIIESIMGVTDYASVEDHEPIADDITPRIAPGAT
jgi:hypothetical protein